MGFENFSYDKSELLDSLSSYRHSDEPIDAELINVATPSEASEPDYSDNFKLFTREILIGLLTAQEEVVLAKKIEVGNFLSALERQVQSDEGTDMPATSVFVQAALRFQKYASSARAYHGEETISVDTLKQLVMLDQTRLETVATQSQETIETVEKEIVESSILAHILPSEFANSILGNNEQFGREHLSEYFGQIGEIARQEELAQIHEESDAAKKTFVEKNVRLAISVARLYSFSGVSVSDLTNDGVIGMMRGIEKFDHRRGYRFSTYAYWWIRQGISHAVAETGRSIRIPVYIQELNRRLGRFVNTFTHENGRYPTFEDLAAEVELSVRKVEESVQAGQSLISLDNTVAGASEDSTLGDIIADPLAEHAAVDAAAYEDMKESVVAALETLSLQERTVLGYRYGLTDDIDRTFTEIGKLMGISRQRAQQIDSEARAKLRKQPKIARDLYQHLHESE